MKKIRKISILFSILLTALLFSGTHLLYASPASMMAADYGVNETALDELLQQGWTKEDLNRAAFLALASGQSLETIANYKSIAKTWEGVEALAGLTKWHVKEAQKNLIANQLNQVYKADKASVKSLLTQKYHPKAVAVSAALASAENSNSNDIEIVMSKKNYGISWQEVGAQLGLSSAQVHDRIQNLIETFANRQQIGDAYGAYSSPYGYQDSDFHKDGYDIEAAAF